MSEGPWSRKMEALWTLTLPVVMAGGGMDWKWSHVKNIECIVSPQKIC